MNKKLYFIFVTITLFIFIIVGCGSSNKLIDGSYLAKGTVSDHGNYGMAIMEVKDGEVAALKYGEIISRTGEEKNQDNFKYREALDVIDNLNEQFNETKDLEKVDFDAITGATNTKDKFKKLVEELIFDARNGNTYEPIYKDGVYIAKDDEDSHGWIGEVKVVIREGQIVGLNYYELAIEDMESKKIVFNEEDEELLGDDGKPQTESVQVKAGDIKSEENYAYLSPLEAVPQVERYIINNNGTEGPDIDSITGATSTRNKIVELVNKALKDAVL